MKCFICGNEIEGQEKDNCPYCNKIEVASPLKLVRYLFLFLSLLCLILGPLVFNGDNLKLIICLIIGFILLGAFILFKPKTSKRLVTEVKLGLGGYRIISKFYRLQLAFLIIILLGIVYLILQFVEL